MRGAVPGPAAGRAAGAGVAESETTTSCPSDSAPVQHLRETPVGDAEAHGDRRQLAVRSRREDAAGPPAAPGPGRLPLGHLVVARLLLRRQHGADLLTGLLADLEGGGAPLRLGGPGQAAEALAGLLEDGLEPLLLILRSA